MSSVKKTLFLVVSLLFGIFGVNVTASAATDYGSQFLTNVTLTNDLGQNVLDSNIEVKDLQDYRLSYDFAYPDTVKPGDTMSVVLPNVLKVSQLSDFDIKNAEGVVVAKASFVEGSNQLNVTFTEHATEKQNNRGSFYISTKWNQKASGVTDGPVSVELPVKGTIERHTVLQKGVKYEPSEFSKFGEMDPKNPTVINYELQLNYNGFNALMENIVGGDILGDGMDYDKDSFEFVMFKDGKFTVVDPSRYTVTFADDNRSFGFTMDKVLPDEQLFIRYKTRVTDGNKAAEYDNKAWIRYAANPIGLTVNKKTKNTIGGGNSNGELVPPVTEPDEKSDGNASTPTDPTEVPGSDEVTPNPETPDTKPEEIGDESTDSNKTTDPDVDSNEATDPDVDSVNEPNNAPTEETVTGKDEQLKQPRVDSDNTNVKPTAEKPNAGSVSVKNVTTKTDDKHTDKQDNLPETGYNNTSLATVVGLLLLGLTTGYVVYRKR